MKKIQQAFILTFVLFASTFSYTSTVMLEEDVDDFTDEVSYMLMIADDTGEGIFGAICNNSAFAFLIMPDGMWSAESYLNVQFRFDRDEPYTERMVVSDYNGVMTNDVSTAMNIFRNARDADSFVVKVGPEDTQRFSALSSKDRTKVDRFFKLTSSIYACS